MNGSGCLGGGGGCGLPGRHSNPNLTRTSLEQSTMSRVVMSWRSTQLTVNTLCKPCAAICPPSVGRELQLTVLRRSGKCIAAPPNRNFCPHSLVTFPWSPLWRRSVPCEVRTGVTSIPGTTDVPFICSSALKRPVPQASHCYCSWTCNG
jgi:hypothetical protein